MNLAPDKLKRRPGPSRLIAGESATPSTQDTRQRTAELAALNQIGQALTKLAPLAEIFELTYTLLGTLVDNRSFFIALYDEEKQWLSFPVYTIDGKRLEPEQLGRAFDNGVTEHVVRTRRPLLIPKNVSERIGQLGLREIDRPACSFVAVPIVAGEKAIGVIALQDYHQAGVYHQDQVELLSIFAGQVGVALENARLYAAVQQELGERKRAEEALRAIAQGVSAKTGEEFFQVLVEHLARSLHVDYALVGQLIEGNDEKVRTRAVYARGRIDANMEYALANTPCENVVAQQLCSYVRGVQQLFPLDHLLKEMEAESYLGTPLFDSAGRALGLMAVLDRRPLSNPTLAESMLQALAARAAAELERQMSQEALRRSEERFRIAARATDDVIWDWDLKTNQVWWSENCEAMLGYKDEELEPGAESWSGRLHPDDEDWVLKSVHTAIDADDQYWAGEYRFRRRDGSYAYVFDRGYIIRDTQRKPVRMIGALMDMTERKRAEEQLQKSEERFRRIVETSFEGICVVDANARITFTNWRMAAMLGYVIEELAGQTVFDFVDEHSREEARKRFKRRSQGISEQFDLCFRRKDGSELWVIINATPIFDAAGVFQGALGMMTDITERKQAESSLQQLTARLLQLQDEERRRIARELHDTTAQNLAALAMSLSCLKTAVPAFEPRAEKALADSLAMAEKCSQEIRTISYLLHPPLLDEVGLLVALRDYVKGFSRRSNIGVDLVLPPQLVRLPREVETALFRIVQESLGNIHRHSGSSTAVIQLQATPSEVQLEIRDAGHGMLADERNAAMTGPASFSALGVGITGMRERMQQLRGRLEIRSTSEGTLIKAILPLQQAIA